MEYDLVMEVLKQAFNSATQEHCMLKGVVCWCLWFRRNKWVGEKINKSFFGKSIASNMLLE